MNKLWNKILKAIKKEDDNDIFDGVAILDSEVVLYLLTEKNIPNILNFAKNMGMYIYRYFNDIQSARIALLTESRPMRIIVLEQGIGKFTNLLNRAEFVELVSLCDKYKKASIFCCDNLLKTEVLSNIEVREKDVMWHAYKGVYKSLLEVKELGEKYAYFKDINEESIGDLNSKLRFYGEACGEDLTKVVIMNMETFNITFDINDGRIEEFDIGDIGFTMK